VNAVCPDGFEYYFVVEEFVVDRELYLRPSNQYIFVSESPTCLRLEKNVCVPGKAGIEMKSKVFDTVLSRYLHIIYMDIYFFCKNILTYF
jgi:hypothetical protein